MKKRFKSFVAVALCMVMLCSIAIGAGATDLVSGEVGNAANIEDEIIGGYELSGLPSEVTNDISKSSNGISTYGSSWSERRYTRIRTVSTFYDQFLGVHPDFRMYGSEKKVQAWYFSFSSGSSLDVSVGYGPVSISVNRLLGSNNGAAGFSVGADSSRWSKCGVYGDGSVGYYRVDLVSPIGKIESTWYEYITNITRSYPKAIYSW